MLRFSQLIGAALAVAFIFSIAPAHAATLLNLPQAWWDEINQFGVALILAIGAVIWKWLDAHSPLKNTQAEQILHGMFMDLLAAATKYAVSQAGAAESCRVGNIDVGSPLVAMAANFVILHGPVLAKQLGFDVTTDDGRAAIIRMVTLRVSELIAADRSDPKQGIMAKIILPSSLQPKT